MRPFLRVLLLALPMVAAAPHAHAYNLGTAKWASSPTLYVNPLLVPSSTAEYTTLAAAARSVYNNASQIGFTVTPDNDYTTASGNGESELSFTSSSRALCGTGADGCTWTWTDSAGTRITEADVYFDSTASWDTATSTTSLTSYGGTRVSLLTQALHEFGHVLGLAHATTTYSVMGDHATALTANGSYYFPRLGEDATSGLRALYGSTTGGYEDLAVSHWTFASTSGGLSTHERTDAWTGGHPDFAWSAAAATSASTSTSTPLVTSTGDTFYEFTAASSVVLEFTLENNGALTQTPAIRAYVSTNNTLSTSDTRLARTGMSWDPWAEWTPTVAPDAADELTVEVTLPSTLTPGATYYLGVIVDPGGAITEVDETNNATWIAPFTVW